MANIIIHDEYISPELDQWGGPLYDEWAEPRGWIELDDKYLVQIYNWGYVVWILWKRDGDTIKPVYRLEYQDYYWDPIDGISYRGGSGSGVAGRIDSETAVFTYLRTSSGTTPTRWISRGRVVKRYGDTLALGPGVTISSGSYNSSEDWNLMPHRFYARHVALDGNQTALFFSAHAGSSGVSGDGHTRAYRFSTQGVTLSVEGPDLMSSDPDMTLAEVVCVRDSEVELTYINTEDNWNTYINRYRHEGNGNWTDTTARFDRHDVYTFNPTYEDTPAVAYNRIATFGSDKFVTLMGRTWSSEDNDPFAYIDVFLSEASGSNISILDTHSFTSEYAANSISGSIGPLSTLRLDDITCAVLWVEPNSGGYQRGRLMIMTYDISGSTITPYQGPFVLHDPGYAYHSAISRATLVKMGNYVGVTFQEYRSYNANPRIHCGLLSYSGGTLGSSFSHSNWFDPGRTMQRGSGATVGDHIVVLYEDGSRHINVRSFYFNGSTLSVTGYSRVHWYTGDIDDYRLPQLEQATDSVAVITAAKNNYYNSWDDIRIFGQCITVHPDAVNALRVYGEFVIASGSDYVQTDTWGSEYVNFEAGGGPVAEIEGTDQAAVTFGQFHEDFEGSDEYVVRFDFSDPASPVQLGEPFKYSAPDTTYGGTETDEWFGDAYLLSSFPIGNRFVGYIENYSTYDPNKHSWFTLDMVSGIKVGQPAASIVYIFGDKLRDGEAVYSLPRTSPYDDKIVMFTREGASGLEVIADPINELYDSNYWYLAKPAAIDQDESDPVVVFVVPEEGGRFSIKKVEGFNGTALSITRELEIIQYQSSDDIGFVNFMGDKYVGYMYPQNVDWETPLATRLIELETVAPTTESVACIVPPEHIYIVNGGP